MPDFQQLQRDLHDLNTDFVKAVSGLTVMVNANKDAIADLRRRQDSNDRDDHTAAVRSETRLAQIETLLSPLRDAAQRLAVVENTLSGISDVGRQVTDMRVAHGGKLVQVANRKVDAENKKTSWALYGTIGAAALPGLIAVALKLLEWASGR